MRTAAETMAYRGVSMLNLPFRPLDGRASVHSIQIDAAYMLTPCEEWGLPGLVGPVPRMRSGDDKPLMVDRHDPDGHDAMILGEMEMREDLFLYGATFVLEDQPPEVQRRVSNLFWRARAVQDMIWWVEALERLSIGQVALLDRERLAGLRWGNLDPVPWEQLVRLPFDRRRVIDALLDFGYPSRTIAKAAAALDGLRKLTMLLHLATELPDRLRRFPPPLFLPARRWMIQRETAQRIRRHGAPRLPGWLEDWERDHAQADADGYFGPGPPSWRDCRRAHRLLADWEAG